MPTYRGYGLTIRSDLSLPPWSPHDVEARASDIAVRDGPVPPCLEEVNGEGVCCQCNVREVLVHLDGRFGMHLVEGCAATFNLLERRWEDALRLFFVNVGLGLLLHQRGHVVLHACAVAVDGRGVAFGGPSGMGKSVLGFAAHRRGYALLADEVCALQVDETGQPLILPGTGLVQLWEDAREVFGVETSSPVRDEIQRYYVPVDSPAPMGVPLRRLYALERNLDARLSITPVTGRERLDLLVGLAHRPEYLPGMGLAIPQFSQCMRIIPHVEVFRCALPRGFAHLDAVLDHAARTTPP